MASPRSTPFIASWDTDDLLDATAPLDELVAAQASPARPARAARAPSAGGPSRRAWSVIGIAGLLAAGAFLWATAGGAPRAPVVERAARLPPPPVRAELEPIAARLDATPPDIALGAHLPAPAPRKQTRPQPRGELAAALLERRRQLTESGGAVVNVDAVADIRFDPSRRSARVVYRAADSGTQVVEYWAVRDGRWQTVD